MINRAYAIGVDLNGLGKPHFLPGTKIITTHHKIQNSYVPTDLARNILSTE